MYILVKLRAVTKITFLSAKMNDIGDLKPKE